MEYNYSIEFNKETKKLRITKIFWGEDEIDAPEPESGWHAISYTNTKNQANAYFSFLFNYLDFREEANMFELEIINEELQCFIEEYFK